MCHCFSRGAVCPSSSSTSGRPPHQSTLSIFAIQTLIKAVICQREWNSVLRRPWFVERRDPVWDRPPLRNGALHSVLFHTYWILCTARKGQSAMVHILPSKCKYYLLQLWTWELGWQIGEDSWLQHCVIRWKGDKQVTSADPGPALKTGSRCTF